MKKTIIVFGAFAALSAGCVSQRSVVVGYAEPQEMTVLAGGEEIVPQLPEVVIQELDQFLGFWEEAHNAADRYREDSEAYKIGSKVRQHYESIINGMIYGEPLERRVCSAALGFLRPVENNVEVIDPQKVPESVRYLEYYGIGDDNYKVRSAALFSLGRLKHPSTNLRLVDELMMDNLGEQPPVVRAMGVYAMGRILDPRADENDEYFYHVVSRLADTHVFVREQAIYALINIDDERATEQLVAYTLSDSQQSIRRATVLALEHFRDPDAVPALVRILSDDDVDLVMLVARVLSVFSDDPRAEAALRELLAHETDAVRAVAAKEIVFFTSPGAIAKNVPILIKLVRDEAQNDEIRLESLLTIKSHADAKLVGVELVPSLIPLLDYREPEIRASAYESLRAITGNKQLPSDPYMWEEWARNQDRFDIEFPLDYRWHPVRRRTIDFQTPLEQQTPAAGNPAGANQPQPATTPNQSGN
ncbi:MAG: HEAT repeat domain-containing protein [Planctomycetes bacterium]|nr:HEAT repeat domain-containing protein [Planctomycetota bacterium]